MENSKIVVVGSSNTDMIIQLDKIPLPGETVIGGNFSMAAGGKGANQAVAAARSGGDVTLVASVGKDTFGTQAVEGFKHAGIEVSHIKTINDVASGVAFIFVDKYGENSIAVASGANAYLFPQDIELLQDTISQSKILLMQLETPLETVIRAARLAYEAGVKIILNPAPAQTLDDELLRMISILTPNESETELLTGITVKDETSALNAAKVLMKKGIEHVLITLGAQGVFMASEKDHKLIPGFKVEAVDTTAAGDVFNGALATALAEGKIIDEAIHFANAAAALSVTKLGAQPSAPWLEEIESFLNENNEVVLLQM
jgi:ribokinase